jgi:hypothetical protein
VDLPRREELPIALPLPAINKSLVNPEVEFPNYLLKTTKHLEFTDSINITEKNNLESLYCYIDCYTDVSPDTISA